MSTVNIVRICQRSIVSTIKQDGPLKKIGDSSTTDGYLFAICGDDMIINGDSGYLCLPFRRVLLLKLGHVLVMCPAAMFGTSF